LQKVDDNYEIDQDLIFRAAEEHTFYEDSHIK